MTTVRSALALAALLACSLFAASGAAAAAAEEPIDLAVPAALGPFAVNTKSLMLVDRSRPAGFGQSGPRKLMVQVTYPARKKRRSACRPAPYLPNATAERLLGIIGESRPAEIDTGMCQGGPVMRGKRPLLVFSHAYTADRAVYTSLIVDLASRGYVVAAVDHTYEAFAVEFPDGKVADGQFGTPLVSNPISEEELVKLVDIRARDSRFVLGRLLKLSRKRQGWLAGRLDRRRIGMLGHSLGGATATQVALRDRRVKAAADIDGSLFGAWPETARMKKPYLAMIAEQGLGSAFPSQSLCRFYSNLTGPRVGFQLTGAMHLTFSDFQVLAPQIAQEDPGWMFASIYKLIVGELDPANSLTAQRQGLARFFNRYVRSIGRKGIKRAGRPAPPAGMTGLTAEQTKCTAGQA